ncbi:MAG: ABC transporter substrate-binding protein [Candidatus Binataceae bacterium]|nr:ABC transporter substrate-binding protein [Candidatus Binataceae bacterium]
MATKIIWYTRCPVPTAAGIAYQRRTFRELFAGSGYEVRNIKELGAGQLNTHFHHELDASFREGGGSPPIWAYAKGAPTRLLAITFMEEVLGIYVRADDPAASVTDLAGRRAALPVWPKLIFNFFRFAAEKGFHSALRVHGMSDRDMKFVDVAETDDPAEFINPDFADGRPRVTRSYYHEQLEALRAGKVDAIFGKGGETAALEREAGGAIRRLYDLRDAPTMADRVNNSTPRLLTVSESLVEQHPEAVTRYVQTLVRTAIWARTHEAEAAQAVAAEAGIEPADIRTCFSNFTAKLLPELNDDFLAALEVMKDFLHRRGYIARNFDVADWLAPAPLAEAYAREGISPTRPGVQISA